MTTDTVRNADATGVTTVPFDRVNFTATIRATRPTSGEAKTAIRPTIDALQTALTALKGSGTSFIEDRTKVDLNISKQTRYNHNTGSNEFVGYTATYTVTVQTEDVDRASLILDTLTNVEGAEIDAPDFRVDNVEQYFRAAFEDGFTRVQARFVNECEVLGKNPNDYQIKEWSARYDDSQSAGPVAMKATFESAAMTADAPPVEVKAGVATISARVTVSYTYTGGF